MSETGNSPKETDPDDGRRKVLRGLVRNLRRSQDPGEPVPPATRQSHSHASLRRSWDENAASWISWARHPGHDHFFWRFNLPNLLALLPQPEGLTIDLGCGEGRLTRTLRERGYRAVGFDSSPALVRAAHLHDERAPAFLGDAAHLPFADESAALVVACMVLQDLDDLDGSIREVSRVLAPGGRFCFAILHPLNTAGLFRETERGEEFALWAPYFESTRYELTLARNGKVLPLVGCHHPLDHYTCALEASGFLIESMREPRPDDAWADQRRLVARWRRVPNALHVRCFRAPRP
jgi:SAM-dependent methyltransferase